MRNRTMRLCLAAALVAAPAGATPASASASGSASAASAAGTSAAARDREGPARRELQVVLDRIVRAFLHKDLAGVMRYYTRDFVFSGLHGKPHNAREWGERLSAMMAEVQRFTSSSYPVERFSMHGNEAMMTGTLRLVGVTKPDAHGRTRRIVIVRRSRLRWIRTADGWMIRRGWLLTHERSIHARRGVRTG